MISISKDQELNVLYKEIQSCRKCPLGGDLWALPRGNPASQKMIVGIGAGREEGEQHQFFVGKAGRLLDEIFAAVGFNTNDWYCTNITHCRPVALAIGKENRDPTIEERKACRHYLDKQIEIVQPKIIVTLGRLPTEEITGLKGLKIGDYRGRLINNTRYLIFPMKHPASMLYSQSNPIVYQTIRKEFWDDIRELKRIIQERNL